MMMNAADFALISAGAFLVFGMLTGCWKYKHMMQSESATAPYYVDICHRTSLMYSFACVVLQQLALASQWSNTVNLLAVVFPVVFFATAVFTYAVHGWLKDTDNQLERPHKLGSKELPSASIHSYIFLLIAAEIGGVLVLMAGVLK